MQQARLSGAWSVRGPGSRVQRAGRCVQVSPEENVEAKHGEHDGEVAQQPHRVAQLVDQQEPLVDHPAEEEKPPRLRPESAGPERLPVIGRPGRPAGQRSARGPEDDVAGDDREDPPHGQEPPPVQPDGEVERNRPHLDERDQLRARTSRDSLVQKPPPEPAPAL